MLLAGRRDTYLRWAGRAQHPFKSVQQSTRQGLIRQRVPLYLLLALGRRRSDSTGFLVEGWELRGSAAERRGNNLKGVRTAT